MNSVRGSPTMACEVSKYCCVSISFIFNNNTHCLCSPSCPCAVLQVLLELGRWFGNIHLSHLCGSLLPDPYPRGHRGRFLARKVQVSQKKKKRNVWKFHFVYEYMSLIWRFRSSKGLSFTCPSSMRLVRSRWLSVRSRTSLTQTEMGLQTIWPSMCRLHYSQWIYFFTVHLYFTEALFHFVVCCPWWACSSSL